MKELMNISLVINNLDIFPLISPSDIVSINELILRMKIIGRRVVKHIMTLRIKTVLKVEIDIIASIT